MEAREFFSKNKSIIVIVCCFLVSATLPIVFQKPYILAILIMTVYIAGCSLAWSILGGMIGQISLGHGAFAALGAYIGAVLYSFLDISPWISMIIAFFVVGIVMTLLLSPCFGLKGAYFSLATIAFGEAFRNIFINWEFVGSGQGMILKIVREESFWMLAFRNKTYYFYVGLFLLFILYLIVRYIGESKLGYAFKTIREDEGTASAIGIEPQKYKMIAAFISCGLTGIMGVFYACYVRYISPELMMQNKSLEFVLPAVIGGISTVEGPLLGSLIIVPLSQYLNSTLGSQLPGSNLVVYSIILIAVVLFQPSGLFGWWNSMQQKKKLTLERGPLLDAEGVEQ